MITIWSEDSIRAVMKELDRKTGLSGAKLPIHFGNAKQTLGLFCASEMYFRFSNYWFQDPDWQYEYAIDVIRHEYAHYMDWELNRKLGHGISWKVCCAKIDARPERLYQPQYNNYYKKLHQKEKAIASAQDQYSIGSEIVHPKYGHGVVEDVESHGADTIIGVEFDFAGFKRLLLRWIVENSCPLGV